MKQSARECARAEFRGKRKEKKDEVRSPSGKNAKMEKKIFPGLAVIQSEREKTLRGVVVVCGGD